MKMASQSTPAQPSAEDELTISPATLALILASALMAVVMLLNALGSDATPVDESRFGELVRNGSVAHITVEGPRNIVCDLHEPVSVPELRRQSVARVSVELSQPLGAEERLSWREFGISVVDGEPNGHGRWLWRALVVAILCLGIWHLVAQARTNLRLGSPRQRLEEVERQFEEGGLSREEYSRRVEEISAHL